MQYQGINSIIALVAQFCCIMLIDYTGRRWAMISGNLFNCVTFIIATALLASFPPGKTNNTGAGWGFIVVTWLYNFSFSAKFLRKAITIRWSVQATFATLTTTSGGRKC